MNPIEAVFAAYRNYFNFDGRASRSEFWWFTAFLWSSLVLLAIPGIGAPLWLILAIGSIAPAFAVTCRRLHDTGRTGWWGLLYLLGLLGSIIIYVMCSQPSNPYNNRFGPGTLQSQQNPGGYAGTQPGVPYAPPPPAPYNPSPQAPVQNPPPAPPVPDPNQPRFCTQCGMSLQPDGRFCTVCGKAV